VCLLDASMMAICQRQAHVCVHCREQPAAACASGRHCRATTFHRRRWASARSPLCGPFRRGWRKHQSKLCSTRAGRVRIASVDKSACPAPQGLTAQGAEPAGVGDFGHVFSKARFNHRHPSRCRPAAAWPAQTRCRMPQSHGLNIQSAKRNSPTDSHSAGSPQLITGLALRGGLVAS